MTFRMKTAILILSAGSLALAQPIRKNGDCTGLTPRLNATSGEDWAQFIIKPTSGFPVGTYQPPLTPQQSINCEETPADLVPEIIAHEGIAGCTPGPNYLMNFTFDERGRVWAVDARDFHSADALQAMENAFGLADSLRISGHPLEPSQTFWFELG